MKIDTPCVKICKINETVGYCIGCGRTRREIAEWSGLTKNERLTIMGVCLKRMKEME